MSDKNYRVFIGFERLEPVGNYELGAVPEPPAAEQLTTDQMVAEIYRMARQETSRKTWTFAIGIAGAIFAAARLGIIAVPLIKARRQQR